MEMRRMRRKGRGRERCRNENVKGKRI